MDNFLNKVVETRPRELDAIIDLHSPYTLGKSLRANFNK